jgi:hypothetical protein
LATVRRLPRRSGLSRRTGVYTGANESAYDEPGAQPRGQVEQRDHSRREVAAEHEQRASELRCQIKDAYAALPAALEAEALPTDARPSAAHLSRQEVELAIQTTPRGRVVHTLVELAGRGGDVAAAAASPWARLLLRSATSSDEGFEAVRRAAVESSASSGDEPSRVAARALLATEARGSESASAGYEAMLKALHVLEMTPRIARPSI